MDWCQYAPYASRTGMPKGRIASVRQPQCGFHPHIGTLTADAMVACAMLDNATRTVA
jgi:hypothetical protein